MVIPALVADAVTAPWRELHTWAGRLGMPAHVTLIPPFDSGSGSSAALVDALRGATGSMSGFTVAFDEISHIPGRFIALQPSGPSPQLAALDEAVRSAVRSTVPGAAPTTPFRPHITVGLGSLGADTPPIAAALRAREVPSVAVNEAWVMERLDDPGARWEIVARLPLASDYR